MTEADEFAIAAAAVRIHSSAQRSAAEASLADRAAEIEAAGRKREIVLGVSHALRWIVSYGWGGDARCKLLMHVTGRTSSGVPRARKERLGYVIRRRQPDAPDRWVARFKREPFVEPLGSESRFVAMALLELRALAWCGDDQRHFSGMLSALHAEATTPEEEAR